MSSSSLLQDPSLEKRPLAASEDKLYQAQYLGSGTFAISKPKRKAHKKRLSKVKNPQRGARRG